SNVPIEYSLGIRGLERVGYSDRQVKQYVDFQWLLSDTLFQRPAFQQLHGNEVPAIGLANFINCADVGMVQRRGSPRFALKALQSGGIFFQFTRQKLQCNMPPEVEVLRRIDHTHATAAQLPQDAVVGNRLTNHQPTTPRNFRW